MTSKSYKIFSPIISLLPNRFKIILLYIRRFRRLPNIKEPVTFNEKIQYRKLFDRNNLLTIAADKLKSKDYIESKKLNIYIPKVLWEGTTLDSLSINSLPNNYVYKANHASRTNLFITKGKHYDKKYLIKTKNKWFSHNQNNVLGEWAYKNIPKKVFIEEYLDFNGTVPDDYKLFVYHGKVKFIQLDMGRFKDHKRNMFDENWNDLNINYTYKRKTPSPQKPYFINDMIKISEEIGKDFDFVRVDLYFYKEQITFGELTIYPGAGYEKFPTQALDIEFGKYWKQKYEK